MRALSFFTLPLPTKLSIYCHFHYSEQNGEFLTSVLGIWRLMNWVDCTDCRSICLHYLRTLSGMFRVTIERRGTKSYCCIDVLHTSHINFFLPHLFLHYRPAVNCIATDGAILISTLHIRALEIHVCFHVYSYHWLKEQPYAMQLERVSIYWCAIAKPYSSNTVAGLW